jgi:hypothetical protein
LGGVIVKTTIFALAAIVGSALLIPAAEAVPVPNAGPSSAQIAQPVAEGCGYGFHWVDGYRRGDGAWIPGHCARN